MLKKKIIIYLLLGICAIGETDKNLIELAIRSSKNGKFELSNKYVESYIKRKKDAVLDYAYLIYGYNLLNLRNYNSAIEKFKLIIKKFPLSQYSKDSYFFIIYAYIKTENPASALIYYKEFKNKFGKDLQLEKHIGIRFLEDGFFYFETGNYQGAEDQFNLILKEFEDRFLIVWSNYYLGLIEFEKNNFKKAEEYFKKVLELGEGDIYFDSILKIGDCYFNLGEYEIAENYYIQLKENKKFSQWAQFQIAMIEKNRGNIEKSIEILNNIDYKEDDELKFNVLYEKANNYIFIENWDEAEKILNNILNELTEIKKISEIYFKLGILNFNKKNFDNSIIFLKKASLTDDDSIKEKSLFLLGYIYYLKMSFNEAFNWWDELKNRYPKSLFIPKILLLKGKFFYRNNKLQEAEGTFKELFEKNMDEESLSYLVDILIKEKKFNEGEIYIERFMEKKKNSEFEFLLGKIFYLKGELDKAKEIFENLKIENPIIKAELTYYLGEIYKKEGDIEKAKEKFREVLKLYGQFKKWKELSQNSLKELAK